MGLCSSPDSANGGLRTVGEKCGAAEWGSPPPIHGAALTWSPWGDAGSVLQEQGWLLAALAVLAVPPVFAVLAMGASCQPGTDCPIRKAALM